MKSFDLTSEIYREYEFPFGFIDNQTLDCRVYRIDMPVTLYISESGTTHKVVDVNGVTHCVPAPGYKGCVLRWKANPPVSF